MPTMVQLMPPCYSKPDYWGYFRFALSGKRILDIGSSIGSFLKTPKLSKLHQQLSEADLYVTADFRQQVNPVVCADAHALPFQNETFDIVIANNVIEHLHDPMHGISEMRRVLKVGGSLYYTVPFLYPIHEAPNDFCRFTRYGILRLFDPFSSVEVFARGGYFSTLSNLLFLLSRSLDPFHVGTLARLLLFPILCFLVRLDRYDKTYAFTRAYFGKAIK